MWAQGHSDNVKQAITYKAMPEWRSFMPFLHTSLLLSYRIFRTFLLGKNILLHPLNMSLPTEHKRTASFVRKSLFCVSFFFFFLKILFKKKNVITVQVGGIAIQNKVHMHEDRLQNCVPRLYAISNFPLSDRKNSWWRIRMATVSCSYSVQDPEKA